MSKEHGRSADQIQVNSYWIMLSRAIQFIKDFPGWFKERVHHKLEHFSLAELKKVIVEGGLPLLIIVVGWEIIEDILFPMIFTAMGFIIHPIFYLGVPVSWALCLHWLAVPFLWGLWMKYKGKKNVNTDG